MSDNLIVVLAIVAIVAICLVSFVTLVTLLIYFTEKKVIAGWKVKTERKDIKAETNLEIEASEQKK